VVSAFLMTKYFTMIYAVTYHLSFDVQTCLFIFLLFLQSKPVDFYHVAIVGAGPAGATCGYYLGKSVI